MTTYVDTDIVSGVGKQDLPPTELTALNTIMTHFLAGSLALVTSKLVATEFDRYQGKMKPDIEKAYQALQKVSFVEEQKLTGFNNYFDRYTSISSPMIEDDPVWVELLGLGLHRTDAHHLMLAVRAKCDNFLTCDGGILGRSTKIQTRFHIAVIKPSELLLLCPRI